MDIKYGGLSGLTFMLAAQILYAQKVVSPAFSALTAPDSPLVKQMERQARPLDMLRALDDGRAPDAQAAPRELTQLRRMLEQAAARPAPRARAAAAVDHAADAMRARLSAQPEGLEASAAQLLRRALDAETAKVMELERRLAHADEIIQRLLSERAP